MKYTIAISAYKGKFLKECIDSILKQTYTDFELILLNDASPDSIRDIVDGYSDSRIKYFKNERNTGAIDVVDNWNKCLSLASGEYYMQMGDDDCLDENYLLEFEKLIFEYPEIAVFHCRSFIIDENSIPFEVTDVLPVWESVFSAIYYRLKGRQQFISDFVYKTNELRRCGGFYKLPLAWVSDDLSSYIVAQQKGIVHLNYPMFRYRSNRYSITSTGNEFVKMEAIRQAIILIKQILGNTQPNNLDDRIMINMIPKQLVKYEYNQKVYLIRDLLIRKGFFYVITWIRSMSQMKLTWKMIARAVMLYFYQK